MGNAVHANRKWTAEGVEQERLLMGIPLVKTLIASNDLSACCYTAGHFFMNIYLKQFIESLGFKGRALDLGAGEFFDVACLKQLGWEAHGVDKISGVDLEKVYVSPLKPFDIVYSLYVIHFLKNRLALAQSAYKNLRSGGYFFVHTFTRDENSSSDLNEESLRKILEDAGFSEIEMKVEKFYDNEIGHKHWHNILQAKAFKL
jgi:SAM-dependent methyltransferase